MADFDEKKLARIDERMAEWVAAGAYERTEWLIGDSSGPRHQGRTGETSLYRIYSMTKPVVSIAALQMVEEGRLQLFHPVAKYLPEFGDIWVRTKQGLRRPRARLTLLHLMTHTSGLSYNFLTDGGGHALNLHGVHDDPSKSLRDEARAIAQTPLQFEPGGDWLYGVNTDVLAAVMEVVEGEPLGEILKRRVFDPLGMAETGFAPGAGAKDRLAPIEGGMPGLLDAETADQTSPIDNPTFARGGHGLFSTLADYAKFAGSLLKTARGEAGLISPATLAHATQDHAYKHHPLAIETHPEAIGPTLEGYGFGFGFAVATGPTAVASTPGAFGWSGAAETWFQVNPARDCFTVFMGQNFNWPGASHDLQAMYHGALR